MNNEKSVKMKKYYDRERFTTKEKETVCWKSDQRCCHCGKPIFVGYGATVDHFVPLNKGGSNRMVNLIPLCRDCNDSKDNKLYNMDYIVYIKDKHRKELAEYLNSYVQVTDYCQRYRLLAYDEYNDYVVSPIKSAKFKKNIGVKIHYKMKLATWDDVDRLHEYLVKYLKKYNSLDDENVARENIIFWLQFGCIYYVERNNEITVMTALTIKHMGEDEDYRGIQIQPCMYVFSYYNTEGSYGIVQWLIRKIPLYMMEENDLSFIPINVLFLQEDKMASAIGYALNSKAYQDNVTSFVVYHVLVGENESYENIHKEYDELNDAEKKTCDFFNKFNDITDKLIQYYEKYSDRKEVGWMLNSMLSPELIAKSDLSKYVEYEVED